MIYIYIYDIYIYIYIIYRWMEEWIDTQIDRQTDRQINKCCLPTKISHCVFYISNICEKYVQKLRRISR